MYNEKMQKINKNNLQLMFQLCYVDIEHNILKW
jgi:hypothetical protein